MDTSRPLSELAQTLRSWIFGSAAVIGLGFHFLISHGPYGWPLALFAIFVASGTILVALKAKGVRNPWALAFLIPILSACISLSLYSSSAIKPIGFFTIAFNLAALAYWLTAPATDWKKGVPLWNSSLFLEAALPFRRFQALFSGNGEPTTKKLNSKTITQIVVGLIVAVPVLILFFALFTDGDQFFKQTLGNWFTFHFVTDDIVRITFDVLITIFACAFFWNVVRRSHDETIKKEPRAPFEELVATRSFLTAISVLFVIFAGFQLYYLFQGSSYILAQGKTYADYAVSGYVQLCLAAGFAFVLLLAIYHLTQMKDRWVRITALVIAVTSFISTISAGKRLWLYVDAYGLTLARLWGAQLLFVILLLFILLVVSVRRNFNAHQVITFGTIGVLGLLSISLLINQEALVAEYNLSRHVAHKGPELDLSYLVDKLSSDAIPTIAAYLARPDWREDHVSWKNGGFTRHLTNTPYTPREQTYFKWQSMSNKLYSSNNDRYQNRFLSEDIDPRLLTLSDLRAKYIIAQLPKVSP